MSAFAAGDAVRVLSVTPPGHVRTPFYVRGKIGTVESFVGHFDNPEELAFGRRGVKAALYRVRFNTGAVFASEPPANDEIDVEIFEHWLENA